MKREKLEPPSKRPKLHLMLDSGAFSAWTRGEKITVEEYASYLNHYDDVFEIKANLDVLPGARGRVSSPKQVDEAARASHTNYEAMLARECWVFPVYHYGEDPKWLDLMLQEGASRLGIGALVGVTRGDRRRWLDATFKLIPKGVKVHGFGMTDFELILRYPWHSVDSSSWLIDAAMGLVYVFTRNSEIVRVHMSAEDRRRPKWGVGDFGPAQREFLADYLSGIGLALPDVMQKYELRRLANVRAIQKLASKVIIYFGMSTLSNDWALNEAGERYRLMAYHQLREYKRFDPRKYRSCWNRAESKK